MDPPPLVICACPEGGLSEDSIQFQAFGFGFCDVWRLCNAHKALKPLTARAKSKSGEMLATGLVGGGVEEGIAAVEVIAITAGGDWEGVLAPCASASLQTLDTARADWAKKVLSCQ